MTRIDEIVRADQPILTERGEDDSVLIIAFTGFGDKLHMGVFEFFDATKSTKYSRILLRDRFGVWYHHGINKQIRDFPQLIDHLKAEAARLKPKKIICIGTSAGGYAAMVVGHHLPADYVHAFGPDTNLDVTLTAAISSTFKDRNRYRRWKLLFSTRAKREYFDLTHLLRQYNRKTRYYIHYCARSEWDALRAKRIEHMPGVTSIAYPCDTHAVSVFLTKRQFLGKILDISQQDHLAELAKAHFCDNC
jgi:hypothetical protein